MPVFTLQGVSLTQTPCFQTLKTRLLELHDRFARVSNRSRTSFARCTRQFLLQGLDLLLPPYPPVPPDSLPPDKPPTPHRSSLTLHLPNCSPQTAFLLPAAF